MSDSLKKRSSYLTNRITDLGFSGCIQEGCIYYIHNKRIVYNDYLSLTNTDIMHDLDSFSNRAFDDKVIPIKWVASKISNITIKKVVFDRENKLKNIFQSITNKRRK